MVDVSPGHSRCWQQPDGGGAKARRKRKWRSWSARGLSSKRGATNPDPDPAPESPGRKQVCARANRL